MRKKIVIGTRSSKLALWQAEYVADRLRKQYEGLEVELMHIVTKGDKILDVPLAKIGGKGLFTKELEVAMLEKRVDLAVHSLKDMPTVIIETDENYKGDYLAFEVDNDSMEPEYYAGDIVICRKLKRDLWQYKLHYKDYDFVIAHSKGVTLKEITNHDVENGTITCHSVNQECKHPDFKLNLREVAYIFNVVEIRQSGKSKKRRR